MLAELGAATLAVPQVQALIGNGVEQLIERALTKTLGRPPEAALINAAGQAFGRIYREGLFERSVVYPGVFAALRELTDCGIALCCSTNKPSRFALPLLEAAALAPLLPMTFCADDQRDRKPGANLLRMACSSTGFEPRQLLHVGDSPVDIAAAHAAGAAGIAVDYGYCELEALASARPDAIVSDLRTLSAAATRAESAGAPR
jgi:phosphoglycolate phosphatase